MLGIKRSIPVGILVLASLLLAFYFHRCFLLFGSVTYRFSMTVEQRGSLYSRIVVADWSGHGDAKLKQSINITCLRHGNTVPKLGSASGHLTTMVRF